MAQYIIYFNQQWVGDHTDEWFASRGPLANAVVDEIKAAGAYVCAGGVDEDIDGAFSADTTSGTLVTGAGNVTPGEHYIGGLTIIDVADEDEAKMWAGRIAEACGWPQQMRRLI